jgi:hypothetical protein
MSNVTPPPGPEPAPPPVVTLCPECYRRAREAPLSTFQKVCLLIAAVYFAIIALHLPFPGRFVPFNNNNVRLDTWTGECTYSRDGDNYIIMPATQGRETTVFEPSW